MALQQDQTPQSNFGSSMLAHFWETLALVCGTAQIGILNFYQKRKSNTANNYTLQCNSLQCWHKDKPFEVIAYLSWL
jgi:hypothetical protein